jgi:RimJ/RimL family protein N-acetyltransferase
MIIAHDGDLILRVMEEDDIDRMAELANNPKVAINLRDGFPHPYTEEHARNFYAMVLRQEPKTIFAIEYRGQYAGNISLTHCSDVYRNSAEIGYFIGEPFWGQGIMTRAVRLITEFGFNQMGLARIHTGVFEFNAASQRVLEKCGYVKEGVFRKAITKNGQLYDEIRFAKIRED